MVEHGVEPRVLHCRRRGSRARETEKALERLLRDRGGAAGRRCGARVADSVFFNSGTSVSAKEEDDEEEEGDEEKDEEEAHETRKFTLKTRYA